MGSMTRTVMCVLCLMIAAANIKLLGKTTQERPSQLRLEVPLVYPTLQFQKIWTRYDRINAQKIQEACQLFGVNRCLNYLAENETDYLEGEVSTCKTDDEKLLFHIYWKGPLSDKVELNVKSFLFTQNLNCSEIHVWSEQANLEQDPVYLAFQRFPQVKFHVWDMKMTRGTVFEGFDPSAKLTSFGDWFRYNLDSYTKPYRYTVDMSDMIRFFILNIYGGLYLDVDTIFLRDLWPLRNVEFAYRWSFHNFVNTALLHLKKGGKKLEVFIEEGLKNHTFHPEFLTEIDARYNLGLVVFDSSVFDPAWYGCDKILLQNEPALFNYTDVTVPNFTSFVDFFFDHGIEISAVDDFFRGAFSYHWHNNWNTELRHGSYSRAFLNIYDSFLAGKMANQYGEFLHLSSEDEKETKRAPKGSRLK